MKVLGEQTVVLTTTTMEAKTMDSFKLIIIYFAPKVETTVTAVAREHPQPAVPTHQNVFVHALVV